LIQVLLVDNEQLLHPGIHAILSKTDNIVLLKAVANINQLRQFCHRNQPEIVLLAPDPANKSCTHVLDYLHQQFSTVKVIVLLQEPDEDCLSRLIAYGAFGGLLKSNSPKKLLEAIQSVANGNSWFSPELLSNIFKKSKATGKLRIGLTKREITLLQLVAAEKTDKEIAQDLEITGRTVRYHLENIHIKLNTSTRTGAA
jgi:DNA-binding NarL/FixJ family response regulator